MPKTRPAESREEKVGAILEAAERRLREGGYQALSVVAIARELGLAQNTIYWYFPSKDDLFVATLRRMLEQIAARKPSKRVGEIERILWFTDQFQALSDLRGAMTERARSSQAVAAFVDELDKLLSRMLANALRDHVAEAELPVAVEAFRATVEGTFVKGLDKRARRAVLSFALSRLIEAPPTPSPASRASAATPRAARPSAPSPTARGRR
jgi:AcrR family transcriptional regulator